MISNQHLFQVRHIVPELHKADILGESIGCQLVRPLYFSHLYLEGTSRTSFLHADDCSLSCGLLR